MKKIVSTQGLTYGEFREESLSIAISERVNNRLEHSFFQNYGEVVHTTFYLSYNVIAGEITQIVLDYTIDNPTTKRLEWFREHCDNFFLLNHFIVDAIDKKAPHVYYFATDLFEMASLIHALDIMSVSLESIMCAIDTNLTTKDAIYTPSGSTIIQIPDVSRYSIKDDTLWIAPGAFKNCIKLKYLDIPCSMINHEDILNTYNYPLKYKVWETRYDGTPEVEDDDDDMPVFDDHDVGYSKNGKILIGCKFTFNEARYEVPDGVEEIDDFAFCSCRHYLELTIPSSVKTIGDYIFGNGGRIIIK